MSKIVQLKATQRGRAGKGASRAVRREGLVPGVVYGDKQAAQMVSLNYRELEPHIQTGRFLSTLVDLEVEGKTIRAIPRDVQFEPIRDFIVHVDFLRLGKASRIAVDIPVHFKGQDASPGIKAGGSLNIVSHTLSLYCSAEFIPDEVTVDVAGLNIGASIHLSDIKLPEGVTAVSRDAAPELDLDTDENDVTHAVAEYSLDREGSLYERHAPQVELPHLGSPKS